MAEHFFSALHKYMIAARDNAVSAHPASEAGI
jgi:hypothetical protein